MVLDIKIGYSILGELKNLLKINNVDRLYVITDTTVNCLYMNYLYNIIQDWDYIAYIMAPGEESKSMDTIFSIYDDLLENHIDRNTLILSFGGGVVGDIAGFVASTYKRGLRYVQIPTTLLSQIDSSVGGKVGVDYGGYKNIIGSFYFPESVFVDSYFLSTLPKREITSGLGEIFKYGLIYDFELFQYTKKKIDNIYKKDLDVLNFIIKKSIYIKNTIVSQDKEEFGIRKILNFGHTIGHSIETYYNFSKFNHGEAVILGILYETYIAKSLGLIEDDYYKEICHTLIPIITPIKFVEDEIVDLLEIMKNDKKNISDKITIVLPVGKGRVEIFSNIDEKLISNSLKGDWI